MVQENMKKRVKMGGFRYLIRPILALKMRMSGLKTAISGTLISIVQYLSLARPHDLPHYFFATRSSRVGTNANRKTSAEIRKQSSKDATIASFFTNRCKAARAW
jgi:hypothetical protein